MSIRPVGFKSILNTGLAINQLDLSLAVPPAQTFDAPLPTSVSDGVPVAGAGRLETAGAEDDYLLTINGAAGIDSLLVETGCQRQIHTNLYGPDGAVVEPADRLCAHRLYEDLPNGLYRFAVTGTGSATTYTLQIMTKPIPQTLTLEIGQMIESGKIGGIVTPGAGNQETTASKDVYNFTLDSDQTVVFDSSPNYTIMDGSKLVNLDTGHDHGKMTGHREYNLTAGNYQITVAKTGSTGTYYINSSVG